jgi:hypothetical protein
MPIQFHEDDSAEAGGGGDLTPRTATITIKRVEEYESKAGKVWIKVSARTADDGEWLNEYLPPVRRSVVTLCAAVGADPPEEGELDESMLIDRQCRVKLKVEPAANGYPAKYRVEKWIPAGSASPGAAAPAPAASRPVNLQPKGPAIRTAKPAAKAAVDEMDGIPF